MPSDAHTEASSCSLHMQVLRICPPAGVLSGLVGTYVGR
jgi:hypothetical protein